MEQVIVDMKVKVDRHHIMAFGLKDIADRIQEDMKLADKEVDMIIMEADI